MHKLISIVLAVALLIAGGAWFLEKRAHSKSRKSLVEKIGELEGTIQETESSFSRRATEMSDLESGNKELQDKIEDRDEEVLALTNANLRLKNKIIKVNNAKETAIDQEGNEVEVPLECKEVRLRVDFDKSEDPLRVSGHTLTNPAYAEIHLEWMRALQLELILSKDGDDNFRVYLDSKNSDIESADLKLYVDPEILDRRWYEKISIGGAFYTAPALSLKAHYEITNKLSLGPAILAVEKGSGVKFFYGISGMWYPLR